MKYLVVPVTGEAADQAVFETALLVARAFESHIEFLHIRPDIQEVAANIVATDLYAPPNLDELVAGLESESDSREGKGRHAYEAFCAAHTLAPSAGPSPGVSVGWTTETGAEVELLARRGRTGDLIVLGRGEDRREVVDQALVASGRPVLIAPAIAPTNLFETIVVAWNDSPEAARALTAATPFLARAKTITILSVTEGEQLGAEGKLSSARLVQALRWHNPRVEVRHLAGGRRHPVEVLLEEAAALRASLLVMGGFSHSRLRELVFGGFTQQVLNGAALPVLIAH